MHSGIIYDVSAGEGVERTMKFKEQVLPIKSSPNEVQQDQRKPEELTLSLIHILHELILLCLQK